MQKSDIAPHLQLLKEGRPVVAAARSPDKAESLFEAHGGKEKTFTVQQADVTDEASLAIGGPLAGRLPGMHHWKQQLLLCCRLCLIIGIHVEVLGKLKTCMQVAIAVGPVFGRQPDGEMGCLALMSSYSNCMLCDSVWTSDLLPRQWFGMVQPVSLWEPFSLRIRHILEIY